MKVIELMHPELWRACDDDRARRLVLIEDPAPRGPWLLVDAGEGASNPLSEQQLGTKTAALADKMLRSGPTRVSIVDGRASSYGLEELIPDVEERRILIEWCLQELAEKS